MPPAQKYAREEALETAEDFLSRVSECCEMASIAGSIRRLKPRVKDMEIVVQPVFDTNLLGDVDYDSPTKLDHLLDEMLADGTLEKRPREVRGERQYVWGRKYKAGIYRSIPLDLFIVIPPAEWGAVFAIRTGSADFSQALVTMARDQGLQCKEGHLVNMATGETVHTPSEKAFFREVGAHWREPQNR